MPPALLWAGEEEEPPASVPSPPRPTLAPGELPADVANALWRGSELGSSVSTTTPTGFDALDEQLPGGGWPCRSLTEILQVQATVAEWRLLAPAMRRAIQDGRDIVLVAPPKGPHLPGLRRVGLDERRLVWIRAEAPAQRLWVTEQLIRGNGAGVLVAWLTGARQEQIRRLQICAQACDGPVFLCRPAAAEHEPSAAPLRIQLGIDLDWQLILRILKRKGSVHEGAIALPSVPGGLESIITPRLSKPSTLVARRAGRVIPAREVPDVVGSPDPRPVIGAITMH